MKYSPHILDTPVDRPRRAALVHLRKKPDPDAYSGIDLNIFFALRERLVVNVCGGYGLVRGPPALRRSFHHPQYFVPTALRSGGIEPVTPDKL